MGALCHSGGIIAFHDTYSWDGPSRLVEEYFLTSDRFTLIGFVDTITAVKKRPPSFLEKLRAVLLLAVRRLYILGRKHLLPGEIRKWSKAALRSLSKIQ